MCYITAPSPVAEEHEIEDRQKKILPVWLFLFISEKELRKAYHTGCGRGDFLGRQTKWVFTLDRTT
jgi:hypothetical protein